MPRMLRDTEFALARAAPIGPRGSGACLVALDTRLQHLAQPRLGATTARLIA